MASASMLSGVTVALPLFGGQAAPLRRVEWTGLGRPLDANTLPASYQAWVAGAVAGAASNPAATYTVQRTLRVATDAIGATVNCSA
jgi:hypothetical protein